MVLYFQFLSWSGMGGDHISGYTRDFVLILHNHICVCDVIIFVLFDVHKYTRLFYVYIFMLYCIHINLLVCNYKHIHPQYARVYICVFYHFIPLKPLMLRYGKQHPSQIIVLYLRECCVVSCNASLTLTFRV